MRAAQLLKSVAFLASYRRSLMDNLAKSNSQLFIINSKVISEFEDKKLGITERKAAAQANNEVINSREATELTESNVKYISTLIDVFSQGHLLLRQIAKGE